MFFKIYFNQYLKGVHVGSANPLFIMEQKAQLMSQEAYERGRLEAEQFYNMQILEYRKELVSLQDSLVNNMSREYAEMTNDFKKRMPLIILSLLKKIWAHLEWEGSDIRSMIDEALMAYAPDEMPLEVYLSSSDMTLFEEMDVRNHYANVVFKEDLSLARGDCVIKSRFGILDGRIETKLKRVEEELLQHL